MASPWVATNAGGGAWWVARWTRGNTLQAFDNLATGGKRGSILLLGKPLNCTVFGQSAARNAALELNEGRLTE